MLPTLQPRRQRRHLSFTTTIMGAWCGEQQQHGVGRKVCVWSVHRMMKMLSQKQTEGGLTPCVCHCVRLPNPKTILHQKAVTKNQLKQCVTCQKTRKKEGEKRHSSRLWLIRGDSRYTRCAVLANCFANEHNPRILPASNNYRLNCPFEGLAALHFLDIIF